MAYMHSNWRDVDAWRKEGLPLGTTSNEAAKMFDATLTQFMARRDDSTLGGLEGTVNRMLSADPSFILGHVLASELQIKNSMDVILSLAAKKDMSNRETLHVEAVKQWSSGNISKAQDVWDDIIVEYPTDIMALRFLTEYSIFFGPKARIRDSVARVLPRWKKEIPLYGYLFGLYSFGLEETNFYSEAEIQGRKGLELIPNDSWAVHAVAHVLEMEGRQEEGMEFMSKNEDQWKSSKSLACHNYWHWALYYVEKGNYEEALSILDSQILPRCNGDHVFPLSDGASLMSRLKYEGVDLGDRWQQLCRCWEGHTNERALVFFDAHMLMSAVGAKDEQLTMKVMKSLRDYVRDGSGPNHEITREVGVPVCEAFVEADKGNFDKAVDMLKPIRYKLDLLGGSRAQRDVFELFLIYSALQSPRKRDQQFVRCLLAERQAKRRNSPMTDRLMAKALALQVD